MKIFWITIGIVAAIVVIILFAGGNADNTQVTQSSDSGDEEVTREADGDSLPSFELKSFEGETISSEELHGTPLVINSWATWCPFCVNELPDFVELQKEFPGIEVIAINRQESLSKARGYTDDINLTEGLTWLLDPNDGFYRSIGGFSMPETLFVREDGTIVFHKRGPMELAEMRNLVETHLNTD